MEFKPCPFCGCENIEVSYPTSRTIQIKCKRCVVKFRGKYLRMTEGELLDRMVIGWNTRKGEAKAKREVLEGLINIRNYTTLMNEITRQLKEPEPPKGGK